MRFLAPLVLVLLVPLAALAQASLPADVTTLTDAQAFDFFLKGLGGLRGMGALPIGVFITQVVMWLVNRFGSFLGRWQLAIVTGVSLVGTVLGSLASGMSWMVALLSGPVVAGLQVLVHQLIVQFSPAKVAADKAAASS